MSASIGSVVLALAIIGTFMVGAIAAVYAVGSNWEPYWERRFGIGGVVAVAGALVGITGWLAMGFLRGFGHRAQIVLVDDQSIVVQDFSGRTTISLLDVSEIAAGDTRGGTRLFVSTRQGRSYTPMFLPRGSTWAAEAETLRAFVDQGMS